MRESGAVRTPAILALAGIDLRFWLQARWPDDIGILEAIAVEADYIERERRRDLSRAIRNEIGDLLDS